MFVALTSGCSGGETGGETCGETAGGTAASGGRRCGAAAAGAGAGLPLDAAPGVSVGSRYTPSCCGGLGSSAGCAAGTVALSGASADGASVRPLPHVWARCRPAHAGHGLSETAAYDRARGSVGSSEVPTERNDGLDKPWSARVLGHRRTAARSSTRCCDVEVCSGTRSRLNTGHVT